MVFVFPFHRGDVQAAEAWLQWVIELGGAREHDLILMPAKGIVDIDAMRDLAGAAFRGVSVLPDAEGIEGHPQGPNSMMRQAIWHCQVAEIGPWTFMEPDCVPTEGGFADEWEREYRAFAKPFMGEFRPAHGVTPDYLSGNMVLPKGALLMAPMLARRGLSVDGIELAFDIVAAKETLPQAHLTKLLQQVAKNEDGSSRSFPDAKSLDILRPGAVFFHPCKDLSLIDRLRERKALSAAVARIVSHSSGEGASSLSHKHAHAGATPAPATTSLISPKEAQLTARVIALEDEIERLRERLRGFIPIEPSIHLSESEKSFLGLLRRGELDSSRTHIPASAGSIPAPAIESRLPSPQEVRLAAQNMELKQEIERLKTLLNPKVKRTRGKKRKPLSAERKQQLRDQLARARDARGAKKAKVMA